jgi:excinuclease UvrABC ATPase subunit
MSDEREPEGRNVVSTRPPIGQEDYLPLDEFIAFLKLPDCEHCNGAGEIETDNNGPIVDCPVCEGFGKRRPRKPNESSPAT